MEATVEIAGTRLACGEYYLLLIGNRVCLCRTDDLFRYDFSGQELFKIGALSGVSRSLKAIEQVVSRFQVKFLLASVDPFILTPLHEELLRDISIPIGAIVCDTHHGTNPLSRILEFCINANVRSVLLQFNQRHRVFFERLSIPVSCSFFSPDLYSFIRNKQLPSMTKRKKEEYRERKNSLSSSKGIFIGSVSNVHRYRRHLLNQAIAMELEIDILRTPDPLSMIELIAEYPWSFNLPLNGDFNRRFVECFLASTCIISELIPDSQLFFPYSLFKNTILFFRDPREIPGLLRNNRNRLDDFARINFRRSLDLFESGYEISILLDFVKPLVVKLSDGDAPLEASPNEVTNVLGKACIYDEMLGASLYADQLTSQQKNELLCKGRQFLGEFYDIENEFHRLCK